MKKNQVKCHQKKVQANVFYQKKIQTKFGFFDV